MKTVAVTFFRDRFATTKQEEQVTLPALAERIRDTMDSEKARLPWLKCARFGDQRTKDGSFRSNANVLAITGIEGDYDAEQMCFDDAERTLIEAGILGLLYTSPSHTEDTPRWRVICPLSQEYPPDWRDAFMARLNGLFGGMFSSESWTLSQSYYFGSVKGNASHRAVVTEGNYIDLREDLDGTAIGRPRKPKLDVVNGQHDPASRPEDITDARIRGLISSLLDNVRNAADGAKHHILRDTARTLGGYLHLIGWSEGEAVEHLVEALPPSVKDWDSARKTAAYGVTEGMKAPLDLEDRHNPLATTPRAPPPEDTSSSEWEGQHPTNQGSDYAPPNGKPRRSRTINILALVTHINARTAWRGVLRFNLLTEDYEVCPPFPPQDCEKGPPRPLRDPHDVLLATMHFQGNGFARAGKSVVWDALAAVAHEHSYHPVRDYLNGLRWDGFDRVGRLFLRYFNAELPVDSVERDRHTAYLEHISVGFMVGAVARAMEPGCKVDHVPVVVGRDQGLLKSTAVRALCHEPAWFSDNISPDLIDRDTKESLRGKWLIELAEIPHIRRETERVKAFFSSQVDRYRAAYGRANQDHPRQCVFIGTSNDLEFVDVTGNRRFWPFLTAGPIDVAAIERDRHQLWAEAMALYRQGVRWWLPPNIEAIASEAQEAFVETDIWDDLILEWVGKHPDPFTMKDLFAADTGITPYREVAAVSRADEMRAARCLKKLKFTKRQKMIGGKRGIWWERQ